MKSLNRNHITVFYAQQMGETATTDEYGHYTGEPTLTYTAPIAYRRFSYGARRGVVSLDPFGLVDRYVQPLVTDDMNCPVTTTTRLWINTCPYDGDGNLLPHTHEVEAVIPTINSIRVLCKEVKVS